MSYDHFTVDGTLIGAWALMKSFRPKNGDHHDSSEGGSCNPVVDFKRQKRKNDTHRSEQPAFSAKEKARN